MATGQIKEKLLFYLMLPTKAKNPPLSNNDIVLKSGAKLQKRLIRKAL